MRSLALAMALVGLGASSAAAYDYTIISGLSVQTIVNALHRHPLVVGYGANPNVADAEIVPLRNLIDKLDPGRLWIVVTPPRSEGVEGQLARRLQADLHKDGTVIAIGGYNIYVADTWGASGSIVQNAIANQSASLTQDLQSIIVAFAKADARAHHPTPLADRIAAAKKKAAAQAISTSTSTTSTSATTGTATAARPTTTSAAPATGSTASGARKKSSSSSTGLIIVLAALAVLVLIGVGAFGRQARRSAQVRKREREEAQAKATADLTKLGEKISDLDIDQQMPNADPGGKAEYVKALDCYQGGERRLKGNDPAEFNKAVEVIAAGLKHIDEAERLFDHHGRARDLLPAEVINRLTKLAALHKSGALTDAEFTAEKQKLLS